MEFIIYNRGSLSELDASNLQDGRYGIAYENGELFFVPNEYRQPNIPNFACLETIIEENSICLNASSLPLEAHRYNDTSSHFNCRKD